MGDRHPRLHLERVLWLGIVTALLLWVHTEMHNNTPDDLYQPLLSKHT